MSKTIKMLLLQAAWLIVPSMALSSPMPDTGQDKCYNLIGQIIPCLACPPALTLCGQDAQNQPRLPRTYTKLGAGGVVLPAIAVHTEHGGQWQMTRDEVTGLVWENKTTDGSYHDSGMTYTVAEAENIFIVSLNTSKYGGFDDWRLPTVLELSTLVDSSIAWPGGPTINTDYFPNTANAYYWSSTPYRPRASTTTWFVYFYNGLVHYDLKTKKQHVRAVRGQISAPHLIDNGDGTVSDSITGLMWARCNAGQVWDGAVCQGRSTPLDWGNALNYSQQLELAGYSDWRLPDRNALQSLVSYALSAPAIDALLNKNTEKGYYWSSTTVAHDPAYAWRIGFEFGDVGLFRKDSQYSVRAVRAGKTLLFGKLKVTILPDAVKIAGARWRPAGTATWHESDQEITLPDGLHLIEFLPMTGWEIPPPLFVTLVAGNTINATGTYTPTPGSVQVTLDPEAVRASGAQWRLVGMAAWEDSGTVKGNVPIGNHEIEFKDIPGWIKPPNILINVASGLIIQETGTYQQAIGLTFITVDPDGNPVPGSWRRTTGAGAVWRNSTQLEDKAPIGLQTVQFGPVNWHIIPPNVDLSLFVHHPNAVAVAVGSAVYSPSTPGDLRVIILPPEAVQAGVRWRRVGTNTWHHSGHVETDVPSGNYLIEFTPGWRPRGPFSVTVIPGQVTQATPKLYRVTLPFLLLLLLDE